MARSIPKAVALNQQSELPSLGELLRKAREGRGLSQTELANQLGVSKQHLSAVEKGISMISLSKAAEMARALNLSVESLAVATFSDHVREAGICLSSELRKSLVSSVRKIERDLS